MMRYVYVISQGRQQQQQQQQAESAVFAIKSISFLGQLYRSGLAWVLIDETASC